MRGICPVGLDGAQVGDLTGKEPFVQFGDAVVRKLNDRKKAQPNKELGVAEARNPVVLPAPGCEGGGEGSNEISKVCASTAALKPTSPVVWCNLTPPTHARAHTCTRTRTPCSRNIAEGNPRQGRTD